MTHDERPTTSTDDQAIKGSDPDPVNGNRDTAYSPSSERETQQLQDDPEGSETDVDIGADDVLPGTGGPDDSGAVESPGGLSVAEALRHGAGHGDPGDGIAPGTDLGARP